MQAVILSGGQGTRLRPLTENIPKGMILIENKPFLQYQLELFKKNGIKNILLCIGYLGEKIINYFGDGRKFGVNITYSIEKGRLLGTAGALKNAEKYLDEEFIVTYGDSYLQVNLDKLFLFYKKSMADAIMCVYKNKNRYDKSNVEIKNNLVLRYGKTENENFMYIDYGLLILKKKIITTLPSNTFIDLEEVFKKLIEEKKLLAFVVKKRFYEIGSYNGLNDFKKFIRRKRK